MLTTQPFIHLATTAEGGTRATFAILLESLGVDRRSLSEKDDFAVRWLLRHMNVINSLYCPSPERTLALRYVARPEPLRFSAGRVDIAILGSIAGATEEEARERVEELVRETLGHLVAAFSECIWKVVTTEQDFLAVWRPFDFGSAHFSEILRREDLTPLEALRVRPSLRRGKPVIAKCEAPEKSVYFVHPFLEQDTTLGRMLRTLLFQPAPVLLQVALSPACLTTEEEAALQLEITKCEAARNHDDDEASTRPLYPGLLETRARALASGLMQVLAGLEDAPFLIQVTVASPAPLGETLVEAIGTEITRPPARTTAKSDEKTWEMFGGGYDVGVPTTEENREKLRMCFEQLRIRAWHPSLAPEPLRRIRHLMTGDEAACAFRLPVCGPDGMEGVTVRPARQRPLPRESAAVGLDGSKALLLGENRCFGPAQPVHLTERDRKQHLYVVGQTGTGKTTLLKTMILSDLRNGEGIAVLDPHGDLFHELLASIPPERRDDVIALDPTDTESPVGVNLLECNSPEERFLIAYQMRDIIERMIHDQYGTNNGGMIGPMFFYHVQMNLLLAMSRPDMEPSTLEDFVNIFMVKKYHERWLPIPVEDKLVSDWVHNTLKDYDYLRRGSDTLSMGEWVASKFLDFIYDPKLRGIFTQRRTTVDFRKVMDEGKILLINLAKGDLAEHLSRFLGMVILAKLQCAAMSRVDVPQAQRRMFHLYVDEFQAIATGSFVTMLSEARKFGLSLVLANQFFSQFKDERIMQSVVGNVGTTICFRVGREDAEALEPQFTPHFDRFDLANLPNWNACVKTAVQGQVVSPFSLATVPPAPELDAVSVDEIIAASRERYGRRKDEAPAPAPQPGSILRAMRPPYTLKAFLPLAESFLEGEAKIVDDAIEGLRAYTCIYVNGADERWLSVRVRMALSQDSVRFLARVNLPDIENDRQQAFRDHLQKLNKPNSMAWSWEIAERCLRLRAVVEPQDGKLHMQHLHDALRDLAEFADDLATHLEQMRAPQGTTEPADAADHLPGPFRLDRVQKFLRPIAPDSYRVQPSSADGPHEPMMVLCGVSAATRTYHEFCNKLPVDIRVSLDGSRVYATSTVGLGQLSKETANADLSAKLTAVLSELAAEDPLVQTEAPTAGQRPGSVVLRAEIPLRDGCLTRNNTQASIAAMGRVADAIEENFSLPLRDHTPPTEAESRLATLTITDFKLFAAP